MKFELKWILPAVLVLFAHLALAQSVTVKGSIDTEKGCLLLKTRTLEGMETLARAEIRDKAFSMTVDLKEAAVALLQLEGFDGGFLFFAEPGREYTAELTKTGNGDIRGGKMQADFIRYRKIVSDANIGLREVKEEINAAREAKHFKTANDLQQKYLKKQAEAKKKMDAVIRRNADNVLAAYLQTSGLEAVKELKPLETVYATLSEGAKKTIPGQILAARIASLKSVGVAAKAPDFTLPTPEGKQVSLYGIKAKLKIIDFWASWCGPCRLENPNMVKLYADFKDKGLEVISVSLDERKMAWTQAIRKDKMNWTHVSSLKGWKCEVVKKYNVDGVPCILVLDEDNRILVKNIRAEKLRAFVEERLGK